MTKTKQEMRRNDTSKAWSPHLVTQCFCSPLVLTQTSLRLTAQQWSHIYTLFTHVETIIIQKDINIHKIITNNPKMKYMKINKAEEQI